MRDVAREAGVSLKTVSRVVNGMSNVSPRTTKRVTRAIARLNFRPDELARNLRRGRSTGALGLVIEDLANPFYSALARGVEEAARERGRLVLIGSSDGDPGRELELVLAFCARRVDGLVLVPTASDHSYLLPELQANLPVICVDRPCEQPELDTVLLDDSGGARTGTEHLIAHGHARIAWFGSNPEVYTTGERFRGYTEALIARGLTPDPSLVHLDLEGASGAEAALLASLRSPDPPTAYFADNNRIALGILEGLRKAGQRRAMIAFDDFELAAVLDPPVTVVSHDPAELGRQAANLLFRRLDGDASPTHRIIVATQLVARGSGELPVATAPRQPTI